MGGADFHPQYYGEEPDGSVNIDRVRDTFEFELAEKYIKAGKPVLGICRGHQLINVYFGGSLYQDLAFVGNCHRTTAPDGVVHSVKAESGSVIEMLYGAQFPVNSFHHQALKNIGDGFDVTAVCPQTGIVEAIEHTTLPVIGVQWHPERMCFSHRRSDTADGEKIFRYFVDLCKKYMD